MTLMRVYNYFEEMSAAAPSVFVASCTRTLNLLLVKCITAAVIRSRGGKIEKFEEINKRYSSSISAFKMETAEKDKTLANGNSEESKIPFLIGVAGGTASGKSTVCKKIMEQLGQADMDQTQRQVVTISQDSFYRELTSAEKLKAQKGLFNFDHPDAFNDQLMFDTLQSILKGVKAEIPSYDYRTNSLDYENKLLIYPADVVLFEGILVFWFPKIRELFHMKLFVDTDSDTRLARRVPRDINERGRDLDAVLTQYMTFVKPAFEEFCSPTKKFADVIIPRGADNTVAIDLIVHHIGEILRPGGSTNNLNATTPHNIMKRDH